MAQEKNKRNQYLRDFALNLKSLNDIEIELPQDNIDDVLENPEQWAMDIIEVTIAKYIKSYQESHLLGQDFARKNVNG